MNDEKDKEPEKKIVEAVGHGKILRHVFDGAAGASIGKVRIRKRNVDTGEVYEDTTHEFRDKDPDGTER